MSVLVDTNVLLRSIEPRHPMHRAADDSVQILRRQGERLVLAPQNVYEFWVAATRPVAQNGLGLTSFEAVGGGQPLQIAVRVARRFRYDFSGVGRDRRPASGHRQERA